MKKLMMTSALVAATSIAVPVMAQTAADPMAPVATQDAAPAPQLAAGHVPAFRASNFTGMRLYALDATAPVVETDRLGRWSSGATFEAERDRWENIGSISDIVMTQDGEIRGVLVDIGGILGFGAHTVLVGIDDLYFVADETTPENLSDFNVVATLSREALEALPAWSDDALVTGFAAHDYSAAPVTAEPGATSVADAPLVPGSAPAASATPESTMAAVQPTADDLLGATVYEPGGESIGAVSDLILNGSAEVEAVVIDVGGFLGMGSHTVALPVDHLDIVEGVESGDLRVEVQMTRDQLEVLPEHQG